MTEAELRAAVKAIMFKEWVENDPSPECFDYDPESDPGYVLDAHCPGWECLDSPIPDRMAEAVRFVEGTATKDEAERVREHLILCTRCRFLYTRLREIRSEG
jgi:hypothetical protein